MQSGCSVLVSCISAIVATINCHRFVEHVTSLRSDNVLSISCLSWKLGLIKAFKFSIALCQ